MRRALLPLLLLALVLAPAAPAGANADPASDTLLYADAHYPYQPNQVTRPLQRALDKMLAEAKRKRYNVKVAIIAARTDLGGVPQLFTEPQQYADLLTKEISFNTTPRVLVVLPSGVGGNNLGDRAGNALEGITVPPDAKADDLARTAMQAVAALSKANGTPVSAPDVAEGKKRGGGTSPLLTFGLPVALVLLAAGIAAARSGRGDDDEPEPAAQDTDEPAPSARDTNAEKTPPADPGPAADRAPPAEPADPAPDADGEAGRL